MDLKISSESKNDWNDENFLKKFDSIKTKPVDYKLWKQNITYFLNAYTSSTSVINYDTLNLIALVLMMPHPSKNQLLFYDYFGNTEYEWHKLKDIHKEECNNLKKTVNLNMFIFLQLRHALKKNVVSDDTLKSFRSALGLLAMVCLRKVGNTFSAVIKDFLRDRVFTLIKELYTDINFIEKLPKPSDAFIEHFDSAFDGNSTAIRRIFVFLVGVYTLEKKKGSKADDALINILERGILNEVRLNAMGEIKLMEQISRIYDIDIGKIVNLFYPPLPPFTTSTFYDIYLKRESTEFSWPWARLIDNSYFLNLHLKHPTFIQLMLAAIVSINNSSVWYMPAFRDIPPSVKKDVTLRSYEYDAFFRQLN